ncbi:MAG: hypothetical protein WAW69_11250 [Polaromonas sp.]
MIIFSTSGGRFFQARLPKENLPNSIYDLATFRSVYANAASDLADQHPRHQHRRYSVKYPDTHQVHASKKHDTYKLEVVEMPEYGFRVPPPVPLPINTLGNARTELKKTNVATVTVMAVRNDASGFSSLHTITREETDFLLRKFVNALQRGRTHEYRKSSFRFLPP